MVGKISLENIITCFTGFCIYIYSYVYLYLINFFWQKGILLFYVTAFNIAKIIIQTDFFSQRVQKITFQENFL